MLEYVRNVTLNKCVSYYLRPSHQPILNDSAYNKTVMELTYTCTVVISGYCINKILTYAISSHLFPFKLLSEILYLG